MQTLPDIGSIIDDRYEIQALLGAGGMGTVYRVYDRQLQREAALKFYRESATPSETARLRFIREARALSAIKHPNVVDVYAISVQPERIFIAMELLQGSTLRQRLQAEPALTPEEAVGFFDQICSAVTEMHNHGIVHRDLKPDNIMLVERAGRTTAVLLDFGAVKFADGERAATLTSAGSIIGTPLYMSPELFVGGQTDERSDVYSLGCLLFEMLSGSLPFSGDTLVAVATKHLKQAPSQLCQVKPGADRNISNAIAKALLKKPDDRWQSAEEFRQAVTGKVMAPPAPRPGTPFRQTLSVLAMRVFTIVFLTAAWSFAHSYWSNWQWNQESKQEIDAVQNHLDRVNSLRRARDYTGAIEEIGIVLPLLIDRPHESVELRKTLGECLTQLSRHEEAAEAFEMAGKSYVSNSQRDRDCPEASDCFIQAGISCSMANAPYKASELLRRGRTVVRKSPHGPDRSFSHLRATSYLQLTDLAMEQSYSEALRHGREAIDYLKGYTGSFSRKEMPKLQRQITFVLVNSVMIRMAEQRCDLQAAQDDVFDWLKWMEDENPELRAAVLEQTRQILDEVSSETLDLIRAGSRKTLINSLKRSPPGGRDSQDRHVSGDPRQGGAPAHALVRCPSTQVLPSG